MSEITLSREPLWDSILEGEWIGQVQLIDTGQYALCIFNSETSELVYSEPTMAVFEPSLGPDLNDVACWQERLQQLVAERPQPVERGRVTYVIRILSRADDQPSPFDGWFVSRYEPDARHGNGPLDVSFDYRQALHFASKIDAWELWKQQSTLEPLRPDGKPNRPLTAFTVSVEPLPDD